MFAFFLFLVCATLLVKSFHVTIFSSKCLTFDISKRIQSSLICMLSDSDSSSNVIVNSNDLFDGSLLAPPLDEAEILKAVDAIIPPSFTKDSNGISTRNMAKGVATTADATFQPLGASYIMCSSCKTAYVMSEEDVGKGKRVQCGVCEKEWFQSTDRLLKIGNENQIYNMTEAKLLR